MRSSGIPWDVVDVDEGVEVDGVQVEAACPLVEVEALQHVKQPQQSNRTRAQKLFQQLLGQM